MICELPTLLELTCKYTMRDQPRSIIGTLVSQVGANPSEIKICHSCENQELEIKQAYCVNAKGPGGVPWTGCGTLSPLTQGWGTPPPQTGQGWGTHHPRLDGISPSKGHGATGSINTQKGHGTSGSIMGWRYYGMDMGCPPLWTETHLWKQYLAHP